TARREPAVPGPPPAAFPASPRRMTPPPRPVPPAPPSTGPARTEPHAHTGHRRRPDRPGPLRPRRLLGALRRAGPGGARAVPARPHGRRPGADALGGGAAAAGARVLDGAGRDRRARPADRSARRARPGDRALARPR